MEINRAKVIDANLRERLSSLPVAPAGDPEAPLTPGGSLNGRLLLQLLEAQMRSRAIDLVARELRARDEGFYTISSAGHEGDALVALHSRPSDMAFLHYRSGAFMMARAGQVPGETPLTDVALSLVASREDPIAGGRHKVWGSRRLNVPPQTSTIASHLPKAVGAAFAFERTDPRLRPPELAPGSIFICSFGDASLNHSTAQGAINAAGWAAFQSLPCPILFLCEDNGLGISVHTPRDWVRASMSTRRGITYIAADGLDPLAGSDAIAEAVELCRRRRRPVFLHLRVVRLLGHAGSDPEHRYRSLQDIEAAEALDPLLTTATRAIEAGLLSPREAIELYDETLRRARAAGDDAATRPRHERLETITAPLRLELPLPDPSPIPGLDERRREAWRGRLPEDEKPRPMSRLLNDALADLLIEDEAITIFGEDVARKGGVYTITDGLARRFGLRRVFNTLLDEQTILGLAIGAAHVGQRPIPEIQYLAYLHNAIDQLRGEASSLTFFSEGQFANPMVVRIASFAYQRGFGGHFHNDNSIAALRDIPGLIVCAPARPADAARLLRGAVALARERQAVVAFLEPIALYMAKDLASEGDSGFLEEYPAPPERIAPFEAGFEGPEDAELLVISYANGHYLSRQAIADLGEAGRRVRLMDLRWLQPLPEEALVEAARRAERVLIVDEGRRAGAISDAVFALLCERVGGDARRWSRVVGADTFIPLGRAWEVCLPSRASIREALEAQLGVTRG